MSPSPSTPPPALLGVSEYWLDLAVGPNGLKKPTVLFFCLRKRHMSKRKQTQTSTHNQECFRIPTWNCVRIYDNVYTLQNTAYAYAIIYIPGAAYVCMIVFILYTMKHMRVAS